MAGIFISYRRDETAAQARAIWERLSRDLGHEQVFMDVAAIPAGRNFKKHIDSQLADCRLMLVVIGPQWASLPDKSGRPRLHAGNDFVRYEVAAGIAGAEVERLTLVPVLIDDAPMPSEDELPDDLKGLVWINAHELNFRRHTEYALRDLVELARSRLQAPAASVEAQLASPPTVVVEPAPAVVAAPASIRNSWAEPWMSREGEDQYGRWADLQASGETQRLRWIAPGRFRMGSPSSEEGRYGDEGPQHEVTLTRGFWLADTACTQALWQAVVGSNASGFKGDPLRPVENVSWNDVTGLFLPKLKGLLGGRADVLLPTEAEWEYACRAGTTTAYCFGDRFDPAKVHVQAKETVPVKALAPNPWGLHQMHGNVWEWCADAKRIYAASAVENPDGGQDGVFRVLRGGSWDDVAGRARSAHRFESHRDYRLQGIGFRFALRSIEPGAGGR
jgi:sulfatase modifying factor 1